MRNTDLPPVLTVYGRSGHPLLPAVDPPVRVIRPPAASPATSTTGSATGHDAAARAAVVPAAPAGTPRPVRQRPGRQGQARRPARRRLQVVLVGAVLLLAVAAVLRWAAIGPTESPEAVVRALFTAMADRDGERLAQLMGCDRSPLCTTAGLRDGYLPPQRVDVQPLTDGRVVARYTIAGTGYQETVGLTRYRQGWLGHRWLVSSPPGGHLDLRAAAQPTLHVAGVDVTTNPNNPDNPNNPNNPNNPGTAGANGRAAGRMWAPPGAYTIAAAGDRLYEPAQITVTVAGGIDPPAVTVTPTLRPDLLAQVEQQIRARIDACAEQPHLHPDLDPSPISRNDCPFGYDSPYTITDPPAWHIDRYPTVTLTVEASTVITVHTVTRGAATVTYRWSTDVAEPRRWTTASATVPFDIGGNVTTTADNVTWTA